MEPNKTDIHKKWSVIMAFALPLLLMVGVLLSSNASFLKPSTQYDFVYAICEKNTKYYSYNECAAYLNDYITVSPEGKFVEGAINPNRDTNNDGVRDIDESIKVRFFRYDAAADESREIILSELQSYTLSSLLSSPDGVVIEYEYNRAPGVLFIDAGSSGYEYVMVKGNRSKVINVVDGVIGGSYNNDSFAFIGWVLTN